MTPIFLPSLGKSYSEVFTYVVYIQFPGSLCNHPDTCRLVDDQSPDKLQVGHMGHTQHMG